MWAASDMLASKSQESLKALGQQLSCFTKENPEKQTYTAAQVASENLKNMCFSNPFNKIWPRQGKLSTAMTAQIAGPFVRESCLLWSGPDASEGGTAQVVNNDVIHPKGKFLPDLIN